VDQEKVRHAWAACSTYAEAMNVLMQTFAAREGKPRWGEKTPAHIHRLREILSAFPKARIIHIVRDPRAVVVSAIEAFHCNRFTDKEVYCLVRYWMRCVKAPDKRHELNESNYLLVKYEDLVSRPEKTLKRVCKFLELEFVPDMIAFYHKARQYLPTDSEGEIVPHHRLAQGPFDSSRKERWQDVLSPRHRVLVEMVAGEAMRALGYVPVTKQGHHFLTGRLLWLRVCWLVSEAKRLSKKFGRKLFWGLAIYVLGVEACRAAT